MYKDVLEAGAMSLEDAQSIMKAIGLCSKGIEGGPEQWSWWNKSFFVTVLSNQVILIGLLLPAQNLIVDPALIMFLPIICLYL